MVFSDDQLEEAPCPCMSCIVTSVTSSTKKKSTHNNNNNKALAPIDLVLTNMNCHKESSMKHEVRK